jgi:SAM-dependent methyltransferase
MVKQLLERFMALAREEGAIPALSRIMSKMRSSLRTASVDAFDSASSTDTGRVVSLWRLNIPSQNVKYGSEYRATDPVAFDQALNLVPENLENFSFIDIGCGKGRSLILAAARNFRTIMGVEFSPELAMIARNNLSKLGIRAAVVQADASEFVFPDDNLLIYMYNPFSHTVMRHVIDNLLYWSKCSSKLAIIVYVSPACCAEFETFSAFRPVLKTGWLCIWKLSSAQGLA